MLLHVCLYACQAVQGVQLLLSAARRSLAQWRRALIIFRRQFEINAAGCLINRTFMSVHGLRLLVAAAMHV